MKQILSFAVYALLFFTAVLHAELRVTSVEVVRRFPWMVMEITVQLAGTPTAGCSNSLMLIAHDRQNDVYLAPQTVTGQLSGFTSAGTYTLVWNAGADYPEYFTNSARTLQMMALLGEYQGDANATYLVIDLSEGGGATSYPCRYTNSAPNFSDDACRTTELWLRRIPAGTFLMGSPEDELGRKSGEVQHQVTLTQAYYIGVFEVTQKQYELVMGSNSYYKGDTRPVEKVSYRDLRGPLAEGGAGWPAYGHAVNAGYFFGKLRAKTGLLFDLPTEAQWEYACRAGTTTALNSGKNLTATSECPNMAEVGRYYYNQNDGKGGYSQHTKVGCYLPNAWGLYDMHGNVWEWCLDWRGDYPASAVTDPAGAGSGSYRVLRGGSLNDNAQGCRSAYRYDYNPSRCDSSGGFRLVCLP